MKTIVFALLSLTTACSGVTFTGPDGGPIDPQSDASPEGAADSADAGTGDTGPMADASKESSADTGADSYVCPTGVPACDDAIAFFCSRMKACCNGSCGQSWQNNGGSECAMRISTFQCAGRMTCESACLSDLQAATCTKITSNIAPAFVASSCMGLWQ